VSWGKENKNNHILYAAGKKKRKERKSAPKTYILN
jgi:hypothetical protein